MGLRYSDPDRRVMALVAFDFDGTLSDDEIIVLLGEQAGRADEIREITERAMAGELSYAESLRQRTRLLSGLDAPAVRRAFDSVRLRPGVPDLLDSLADAGVAVLILTGGFEGGVEAALDRAGVAVDRVVANRLVEEDGRLTGGVEGPLVDVGKDEVLAAAAAEFGVDLRSVVAVGDGANDVPMLDVAGTAVGFRPKPSVASHCDHVVDTVEGLGGLLDRVVGTAGG